MHSTWLGWFSDVGKESQYAQHVHRFTTVALLVGSRGSSFGTNLLGVPRKLFGKTGSAASSRSRLLTVLHVTQPANVPMMNSSDLSFMPNKDAVPKLVCDRLPLLAGFLSKWKACALKCTLKSSELICALHSTRHDLTSDTHATCSGTMTTPCNSRIAITNVPTFSFTNVMVFMPTDAECFVGAASTVALTSKKFLQLFDHDVTRCSHCRFAV